MSLDPDQRLRAPRSDTQLHVVLVEPEIPPNTGNIARLCAATRSTLHLIHPLGFDVSEKAVRRAGLDYWHLVRVEQHDSFASFVAQLPPESRLHLFTGKAERSYLDVAFENGDYLVFGKESTGLEASILSDFSDCLVAIPTLGKVRSLNLANAAALGVYEALRQLGALADPRLMHRDDEP